MAQAPILLTPIDPSEVVPANGNKLGFFAGTDGLYHLVQSNGEIDTLATDDAVEAVAEVFDFRAPRVVEATGPSITTVNITHGHQNNAIASDLYGCTIIGGGTETRNNVIGADVTAIGTHPLDNGGTPILLGTMTPVTGTGANLALIGGGYHNVAGGLASTVFGYHNGAGTSSTHGTISGGSWNWIVSTADYATIAGGTGNRVSADNATVVGGRSNDVSGANAVAGGSGNNVSAANAVVFGANNTVSGANSSATGIGHIVSADNATALGRQAKAVTQGQIAFSSSDRVAVGDSQGSLLHVRRQTTDATASPLGVAGGTTSHTVQVGQVIAFVAIVKAVEPSTMECAAWMVRGLVRRAAGSNSTVIGTPIVEKIANTPNAASWDVTVGANSWVGLFNVRGIGEVGKTINWTGVMLHAEGM